MQSTDYVKKQLSPLGKINLTMVSDSVQQLANLLEEDEEILSSCITQKNELLTLTDARLIMCKDTAFKGTFYELYEVSSIENVLINKKIASVLLTFLYGNSDISFKLNDDKKTNHFLHAFPRYIQGESIVPQAPQVINEGPSSDNESQKEKESVTTSVFDKVKGSWKKASEEAERKGAQKKEFKNKKRAAKQQELEYWFGPQPTFQEKVSFDVNQRAFQYAKEYLLYEDEEVLYAIAAEYDKTQKQEIKGVLIATSERLLFVMADHVNQFVDQFEYQKMKGIHIKAEGFTKSEVYLEYNRSKKKFDDLSNGKELDHFISLMKNKINENLNNRTRPQPKKKATPSTQPNPEDKYKQLEKLGDLKDKGILSDEEFQQEKEKILNN